MAVSRHGFKLLRASSREDVAHVLLSSTYEAGAISDAIAGLGRRGSGSRNMTAGDREYKAMLGELVASSRRDAGSMHHFMQSYAYEGRAKNMRVEKKPERIRVREMSVSYADLLRGMDFNQRMHGLLQRVALGEDAENVVGLMESKLTKRAARSLYAASFPAAGAIFYLTSGRKGSIVEGLVHYGGVALAAYGGTRAFMSAQILSAKRALKSFKMAMMKKDSEKSGCADAKEARSQASSAGSAP